MKTVTHTSVYSFELIWSSFFGTALSGFPPDDLVCSLVQSPLTFELYIAGTTQGGCFPIFYQPNAYNQPVHGHGHFDAYISKFSLDQLYFVTSMEETYGAENPEFVIFPNPGSNGFQLQLTESETPVDIQVYDLKGVMITTRNNVNASGSGFAMDASSWPRGMYVIRISNAHLSETLKWIKQ